MALIEGFSRSKWPALGREVSKGGWLIGWVLSVEVAVNVHEGANVAVKRCGMGGMVFQSAAVT